MRESSRPTEETRSASTTLLGTMNVSSLPGRAEIRSVRTEGISVVSVATIRVLRMPVQLLHQFGASMFHTTFDSVAVRRLRLCWREPVAGQSPYEALRFQDGNRAAPPMNNVCKGSMAEPCPDPCPYL